MTKATIFLLLIAGLGGLGLTACASPLGEASAGLVADEIPARYEPPEEYASMSNPLARDRKARARGETLYQSNCASCHGASGEGDGPVSANLDPKPQNLAARQQELSDGYLYWRIAEGGMVEPFNSLMPSWKGLLREEQIWQVVAYLRTLGE